MMRAAFPAHVSLLVPPVGRGDVGKGDRPLARKALLTVLLHCLGSALFQQVHQDWDQGGVDPSDRLWHIWDEAGEAKCEHMPCNEGCLSAWQRRVLIERSGLGEDDQGQTITAILAKTLIELRLRHRRPDVLAPADYRYVARSRPRAVRPAGGTSPVPGVLAAITGFIGAIVLRSLVALWQGTFLPAPAGNS
jgi:hypothetical protein